ncbi:MAG: hypothetical protein M1839_004168 [Geoglossum umbratile]|nr:MAG: hypothetical protein M1839_004168 [Geoglossum umbratile]
MSQPMVKLPVTHDVLVTQSFLDIIAENPSPPSSDAAHQVNEVGAWLNAEGSECECVHREMLTTEYRFPNPPPNWGKDKPHWYCSGGGQLEWEEHERNRRWVTSCLAYFAHPKNKDSWEDITTGKVAAWVEMQGMGF